MINILTSLGSPKVLTQNCNKQTQKRTKLEMPFPLYLCETMIRHLRLTAFASVVIIGVKF